MAFGKLRVGGVAVFVLAVGIGFVMGYYDVSPGVALRVTLIGSALAGLAFYWWRRRMQQTGEFDERHFRIQTRSSTAAFGVVVAAVSLLALLRTFGESPVPTTIALWTIALGGVVLDQLFVEWYRRRM